ncbi:MAG: putative toxin-antitoxin system toxin component, PIN family [Rhodospirillales bacterium]|jgi:putative PIN family toxin of toxin-antitoxin system
MTSIRVVLDTNIVLSALLFRHGALSWLSAAWQAQAFQPLICRETAAELVRVLAYPKFKLTGEEREELLAEYLPWGEIVHVAKRPQTEGLCRDRQDEVFLELALVAKADALVTGDGDLLALKPQFPRLILTAEEFSQRLNKSGKKK